MAATGVPVIVDAARATGVVAALLCVVCGTSGAAAGPASNVPTGNLTRGCVETFDATRDYFPDKVEIEDAGNFRVEYRKSYKVVTINETYAGGPPERYVLAMCGTPGPSLTGDLAGAQVVSVPISSLFVASVTHLAPLVDLDRVGVLSGVSQVSAITSPDVRAHIATGNVVEFARVGQVIDVERVVSERPAVFMAGASANATHAVIRSAGTPVVLNADWLEPTALARAEWLKYTALFLNEERKAQRLHGAMKARYRALAARVARVPDAARPSVMTGRSTRGLFTIAGGRSYVAGLIADAGGRYVWADNAASGSTTVDFEAQLQRASNADVWINGGGWWNREVMLEDEPRYREFKAYRDGRVWVYEKRLVPGRGNDYWSRSVTRPDLVLADLIKVFHPGMAEEHTFEWYMRVPPR